MSTPLGRRTAVKQRRQQVIQILVALVALGWVSAGSHAIVRWIGFPDPWAWAFPAIVDLGILYITPYQTDATLPNNDEWPVRRHAASTRRLMWWTVAAFNVFHMVQMIGTSAIVAGPQRVVAYVVGVIVGLTPVVVYGRIAGLETMVSAWHAWRADQNDVETEEQRQEREDAEKAKAEQREREERERRDRIAEQERADRIAAEEREARLREKAIDADVAIATAATVAPARESRAARTAPRGLAAVGPKYSSEAEVNALLERLPGTTKSEKVKALLIECWDAGEELNGTDASRRIGCDPKLGKVAAVELKEEGVHLPPSMRGDDDGPRLALAPAADG